MFTNECCINVCYLLYKRKINAKRVAYGHQTIKKIYMVFVHNYNVVFKFGAIIGQCKSCFTCIGEKEWQASESLIRLNGNIRNRIRNPTCISAYILTWNLSGLAKVSGGGNPRGAYELPEVGLKTQARSTDCWQDYSALACTCTCMARRVTLAGSGRHLQSQKITISFYIFLLVRLVHILNNYYL